MNTLSDSPPGQSPAALPIIGLTGGIGSGKTAVAEAFRALGAAIVDTDVIAHALTAANGAAMPMIRAAFGAEMLGADGALNRAKMREQIFADPTSKAKLEAILHPMIVATAKAECRAAAAFTPPPPYVIDVVPLLAECPQFQRGLDRVIVVDCSEAQQIARVMARNHLSPEAVRAMVNAQATRAARLAIADDIIDNHGDWVALQHQVETLHHRYLQQNFAK
jgi:dephospho-CoA kinase